MDNVSLRLPRSVLESLGETASRRGVARSEIVREALARYLAAPPATKPTTTVERIDALVTYAGSGTRDLGSRSEEHLRKRFRARRRHRPR